MALLAKWLIVAIAFLLAAYWVPGIHVESFYTALILALFWGILYTVIRPIFIVLTLPITILTLGLFTLVINGFLLWGLGTIIKGFEVSGFWAAFMGALIITIMSWFGDKLINPKRGRGI